ncbi:hypothetical protein AB0N59_05125 [Microbacterium sp. NPDC089321]
MSFIMRLLSWARNPDLEAEREPAGGWASSPLPVALAPADRRE